MNLFNEKKNYYDILGISDSASQQEIEEAYNNIKLGNNSKKLERAYKTLSDVQKRKKYDKKIFENPEDYDYEESKPKKTISSVNEGQNTKLAEAEQKNVQSDGEKKEKLNVYPKTIETLGKNKYRLIAGGLAVVAALAIGYKLGKANSSDEVTETTITETENNNEEEQIQET